MIRRSEHQRGVSYQSDAGSSDIAEWKQLKKALLAFTASAQAAAERPEAFWERQRLSIRSRLETRNAAHRPLRPAWVCALGILTVALLIVPLIRHKALPEPDLAAGYDQQLLTDVEEALERGIPAPLEPASLLPEEMFPRVRMVAAP